MRTFMKWQGNKSKHLKKILPEFPTEYNTYIEPFVGSGSVFLKLKPTKWIINDINNDNINIWRLVKNDPNYIRSEFYKFKRHFLKKNNEEKKCYCRKKTDELNTMINSKQKTILFMLMSYCAYLGNILIRKKYYFQGLEMRVYIDNRCFFLERSYFENIMIISKFLNSTKGKIYNHDYKKITGMSKKGDFIYLDPPYVEDHDYGFKYNKNENLNHKFINELKQECDKLTKKKVKWLMTQADNTKIRQIFSKYTIKTYHVYRKGSNSVKSELIIKNF